MFVRPLDGAETAAENTLTLRRGRSGLLDQPDGKSQVVSEDSSQLRQLIMIVFVIG